MNNRHASFISLAVAASMCCMTICARSDTKHSKPPTKKSAVSSWEVEAREYLGTPESEAAVNRGLAYLASSQLADGHWSSGGYRGDVGITGLCLLAFLASGHQPGRGKYGLVMEEAVNFLASCVQMSGQI